MNRDVQSTLTVDSPVARSHVSTGRTARISDTVGHKYVDTRNGNTPSPARSCPNRPPNGGLACVRQYECWTTLTAATAGCAYVTTRVSRRMLQICYSPSDVASGIEPPDRLQNPQLFYDSSPVGGRHPPEGRSLRVGQLYLHLVVGPSHRASTRTWWAVSRCGYAVASAAGTVSAPPRGETNTVVPLDGLSVPYVRIVSIASSVIDSRYWLRRYGIYPTRAVTVAPT